MKLDQQLKYNDCGISAVKTVYSIHGIDINRKYIEENILLDELGSSFNDIKSFFDTNGCVSEFSLLDTNSLRQGFKDIKELLPVILPVKAKEGLHYVVIDKVKNNKLRILDPAKAKIFYVTELELRNMAYFKVQHLDLVSTDKKLGYLINKDLKKYDVKLEDLKDDYSTIFNKLTYFTYLSDNFGFKNSAAEKSFLKELLFNLNGSFIPKEFKNLKPSGKKIKFTVPIILSVKMDKNTAKNNDNLAKKPPNVLFRLISEVGSASNLWYIFIFASLVVAVTTQLAVFINQILIDKILPSFQLNILFVFIIGLAFFKLFTLILNQYKRFVAIHLGNYLDKYFLNTFDANINAISLQAVNSYKRGDLLERVSDSLKMKSFFLRFFTKMLVDVVAAIYSLSLLFFVSWKISMTVIVVVILYYAWFRFVTPLLKENEQKRFYHKANLFSTIVEKIDGIQVIKSFSVEYLSSYKLFNNVNSMIDIQTKVKYINILNTAVVSLITTTASVFIIYALAKESILHSTLTIGQIITFILLSGKIFSSLGSLLKENLTLQEHLVILRRYFDFLDLEKAPHNGHEGEKDFVIKTLKMNNLSFFYNQDKKILNDVNFSIAKGDKIRIIGSNGSGKSTLCKILSFLYIPNNGKYLINKAEHTVYDTEALRKKILLVSNADILFNDTLQFNITLGRKVPQKKIIALSKLLDFYDFIFDKEDKLNYMITEQGRNVSTGQRKKILLLRGLLSSAEILIYDEVLTGLDAHSRDKVEKLLNLDNRTIIIISHEPINYVDFNKSYRIKNGKLYTL